MSTPPLFGLPRTGSWLAWTGIGVFALGVSGCSALNFKTKAHFIVPQGNDVNISLNAWNWED
ncbi:MAG: hypothetical protein O3B45_04415, partial [Bacteroidetes bacterium]|nr:hypothetical protein [Bacteroidota bacterium]